jgi:repressor of nif and glnA expression
MVSDIDRKINAILRIISEAKKPIGSSEISLRLKDFGIDLTERAVRYHLKIMDERGLTEVKWKEGRSITERGREELKNALVSEKVGFVISRIESMAYQMDFGLSRKSGTVILNISFIPKDKFKEALKIMRSVFDRKYSMGEMVAVAPGGEELGGIEIPKDKIGFGTLCSINLNGILLKQTIPVESRFGGVLQVEKGKPLRFTELISYSGSTLDPLEIFIKSRMTTIGKAAASGSGKVMAGFREIPAVSKEDAEKILKKAEEAGLGSALVVGKPNQPLLGVPVGMERVGIVVPGGLNPVAALEEEGIETESKALTTLIDYSRLRSFWECV